MRIINLMENTEGVEGCINAHGLSFYVETENHRLLMDLGPSGDTLENAKKLGIDLGLVDTVILSHGHYDHSGGIIPFTKINKRATIYMQESALNDYYGDDGRSAEERYRYIGVDKEIKDLSQLRLIRGDYKIDDELELFTVTKKDHEMPFTNKRLLVKEAGDYKSDDFRHEHCLLINYRGQKILMSGCAHNGMLNILDSYKERYKDAPDMVISGFHLMKKKDYKDEEIESIKDLARELKKYPTTFVTCHCTGLEAYSIMKGIMGEKLSYVHTGEELELNTPISLSEKKGGFTDAPLPDRKRRERRKTFMKWHKFFAWATVICFLLTMCTGYKKV
ncbi:MAG: MBL fold metallo-hydrolase [Lachnospiraceae bacterium]|nr:MBL fold metallo-hydrolase [Lachnospiraceae bacterium]